MDELVICDFTEPEIVKMNLEARRLLLKKRLHLQVCIKHIGAALQLEFFSYHQWRFNVKQAMFCSMHMENCLSGCLCAFLFGEKVDEVSSRTQAEKWKSELEYVVNRNILSDAIGEADWHFPRSHSHDKTTGQLKISNATAQKVVD